VSIDNNEWESGERFSLKYRIVSFLNEKENSNRAFTAVGIMKGLGYRVSISDITHPVLNAPGLLILSKVMEALNTLVTEGSIDKKEIKEITGGEQTYYRTVKSARS